MRILETKTDSTAYALTEIAKKPGVVVNPLQQKCVELVEQARSGFKGNAGFSRSGPDVAQEAITLMGKLGCGSTVR